MNDKIFKALIEQIRLELFSSHVYLSVSSYLANIPYDGFAKWFRKQANEEQEHGMKIYDYIIDRNLHVDFPAIEKPPVKFNSLVEIFTLALEHERKVTKAIHHLYELAGHEKDYATQVFLQWYITEQVEEEKNAQDNLDQIILAGDNIAALFVLDLEFNKKASA